MGLNFYANILEGSNNKTGTREVETVKEAVDIIIDSIEEFAYDEQANGNVLGCVLVMDGQLYSGSITKKTLTTIINHFSSTAHTVPIALYPEIDEYSLMIGKTDDYDVLDASDILTSKIKMNKVLNLILNSYANVLEGRIKKDNSMGYNQVFDKISEIIEKQKIAMQRGRAYLVDYLRSIKDIVINFNGVDENNNANSIIITTKENQDVTRWEDDDFIKNSYKFKGTLKEFEEDIPTHSFPAFKARGEKKYVSQKMQDLYFLLSRISFDYMP